MGDRGVGDRGAGMMAKPTLVRSIFYGESSIIGIKRTGRNNKNYAMLFAVTMLLLVVGYFPCRISLVKKIILTLLYYVSFLSNALSTSSSRVERGYNFSLITKICIVQKVGRLQVDRHSGQEKVRLLFSKPSYSSFESYSAVLACFSSAIRPSERRRSLHDCRRFLLTQCKSFSEREPEPSLSNR